ncbi:hypothetical protein ACIGKL_04885 [Pseudomonas sp. NPDC077186]|uniref:hypothetical protein n=1 Tax=Pseudomonas sp. NPDC077186 TaxID=3364421 RepID=UPI0037C7B7FD
MSYQRLINDLQGLLQPERREGLPVATRRGARAGKRVSVPYVAPPSGAGISWPLVEGSGTGDTAEYARTYHGSSTVLVTTDGLVALELPQLAAITMHDANGEVGEIRFAERPVEGGEP